MKKSTTLKNLFVLVILTFSLFSIFFVTGCNSENTILTRDATNNDIDFDLSNEFSLNIEYAITPRVDINNLEITFKYYDKKYIQFAKEIHNSMIEHLDEKISLKQLTAEKDFNLSLFHKVFTQIYGDTPYAYMKKYKMNIAANELKNTDRKINDIAMSLGYSNASKFSIAFHSVYGILPKDYRKK